MNLKKYNSLNCGIGTMNLIYCLLVMLIVLILAIGAVSANEDIINGAAINDNSMDIHEVNCLIDANNNQELSFNDNSYQDSFQGQNNACDGFVKSSVDGQGFIQSLDNDSSYPSKAKREVSKASLKNNDDVIIVNDWDELQYYAYLSDRNYVVQLKKNTNYYPTDPRDNNYQIVFKNNMTILGNDGAYIGDSSSDYEMIHYVAMFVPDDSKIGISLEGINFKWIGATANMVGVSGIFLQMGGNGNNSLKDCHFEEINVECDHSSIVYLKKGNATLENCSFKNCVSNFGCISIYDPSSVTSAKMIVRDCYFENNYANVEPGCINNCGILEVYNSTFYRNRAFWWAGAIHTHGGANTTIYDSDFINNVAGWNGGALYCYSYLQVFNTRFIGNNCTTNYGGGAIGSCKYISNPHIYVSKCLFEDNANNCWHMDNLSTTGTGRGGAIAIADEGSLDVTDSVFIRNSAALGTAISARGYSGYGSPDVYIVNNSFINHTRIDDVLNIQLGNESICIISNNSYEGNSIVFSNLALSKLSEEKEYATLKVDCSLANPSYYDEDILSKTSYDVYVNGRYVKTVDSSIFNIDFGDLDICDVYVVPTISNRNSNLVTVMSARDYIYVSKDFGDDENDGSSRDSPVNSISKALELAVNYRSIILLDGDYSEALTLDYDVTIKGESNARFTNSSSFTINNNDLTLKNLRISNLNSDIFIKQDDGNLTIENCIFENNTISKLIEARKVNVSSSIFINNLGPLVYNDGSNVPEGDSIVYDDYLIIKDSILLNNTNIVQGISNYDLDYNWWGNALENKTKPLDLNINNWIILNAKANPDALEVNQSSEIQMGFYLNDGTQYFALPEIYFNILPEGGIANANKSTIYSKIQYTLTSLSDGCLNINYNDVNIPLDFEFLKSNPYI